MKYRYFIEIMFDGTAYHGWQVQPNSSTVQEQINQAISTVLGEDINVVGAGRTDTGVHAKQMFAHFDSSISFDGKDLIYKLNSFLKNDISVLRVFEVDDSAHSRFDAVSRKYEYLIHANKNPFLINKSWYFHRKLDVDLMNEASKLLLNYTDFTSFSKLHTQTKTNNCSVKMAVWEKVNDTLVFSIEADRFLRNMVRAIVGTLVTVGEKKISIEEFVEIIESKNRSKAGASAPAHGLYLVSVKYPKTICDE
ncbi:MAG: tRNA pseudouridine(38-40) synthase TruA [Flavobacteriales bacterium]|nr:tRNA pseudouridine(38-40) synthase TruA [Flavobacteriales bacterium]